MALSQAGEGLRVLGPRKVVISIADKSMNAGAIRVMWWVLAIVLTAGRDAVVV